MYTADQIALVKSTIEQSFPSGSPPALDDETKKSIMSLRTNKRRTAGRQPVHKNAQFDITSPQLIAQWSKQHGQCPISGAAMSFEDRDGLSVGPTYPCILRVDPDVPFNESNVLLVGKDSVSAFRELVNSIIGD